ncbi:uncharacterized protein K489DRAFT_90186 [Dissoconium aciculare CBS 342.82]|uniref:Uncharacterized protein n=1 Tax=Dissoconium aciculare CBS 342.82 TaxID=1314786 RepID=A0A6J3LU21_9PEZI|nr:uncharacterized protein K489DRAFT_90186 [Dissoconium aciculare CBS 342.82]KAF1818774.1 hypothetical protein K489DRAFT_90186 [Dissoconium aciculare CBS 342.82]
MLLSQISTHRIEYVLPLDPGVVRTSGMKLSSSTPIFFSQKFNGERNFLTMNIHCINSTRRQAEVRVPGLPPSHAATGKYTGSTRLILRSQISPDPRSQTLHATARPARTHPSMRYGRRGFLVLAPDRADFAHPMFIGSEICTS